MRGYPRENFKKEKVLDLYLVNPKKKVKVSNLLGIHLDPGLIQLVLLILSDHRNLSNWAHHHRVQLSKVEQCQRSILAVASFIHGFVAHHSCVFSVGRQDMLKGSARH